MSSVTTESLEERLRKATSTVIEMAPGFADAMRDLASATATLAQRLGQLEEKAKDLSKEFDRAKDVDKDQDPTA